MAGDTKDQDNSQKTESPTQKRLDEAKKRGEVAYSRELMHWFVIGAMAIVLFAILPKPAGSLMGTLKLYIEQPHTYYTDSVQLGVHLKYVGLDVLKTLAFPFSFLIIIILIAGFSQTRFIISFSLIKPKLENVSPTKGFKKLFSKKAIIEFLKNLAKVIGLSVLVIYVIKNEFKGIERWATLSVSDFLFVVRHIVFKVFVTILATMLLIAILDFIYERFAHLLKLKMSRKDIQDEQKDTEGNPQVKGKIRQIRQARARKNMMQSVPQATVVVTNPTHYAVAIKYEEETMDAPVVIAKGRDYIALKIREIAQDNKIPIVENPPLARSLFNNVNLDEEIPYEHYQAVSEVIRFVMELKRKRF